MISDDRTSIRLEEFKALYRVFLEAQQLLAAKLDIEFRRAALARAVARYEAIEAEQDAAAGTVTR